MTTEFSGGGDVSKSLELLWDLHEKPTRGPKPGLTLERIVEAAVAVADAEGLAALSMRRVAAELGVGTMSLYRYVPGKSELLDLMLDAVVGPEDGFPDSDDAGWREVLEAAARGMWTMCLRHPWYAQVDQARPLLGPNNVAAMEYVLRHLRKTDLSDQQMVMAVSAVDNLVTSVARAHVNAMNAEQRTGISEEDFWAAQEPVLVAVMNTGRYPVLASLDEDTFTFSYEDIFEFGIRALLDGIQAHIERAGS